MGGGVHGGDGPARRGRPIMTHNGRWFMTGGGTLVAAFYFGATAPAGPEDETTPLAAGADWANGKLDADNFR
jgi:hypothetical protein